MNNKQNINLIIGGIEMKKFYQKIYYRFKCLKDRYNKLSETNKLLTKFGICIFVFIIFCLIFICCA